MNQPSPPTSKLAIAALVCAVLFCVPFSPLVGVILGIIALININKSQGRMGGQVLAIIAVAVGALAFVANIGMLAAIAIPNFIRYQLRAKTTEARVNLAQIRTLQEAYLLQHGRYLSTQPEGADDYQNVTWTAQPCPDSCVDNPGTCTFACLPFRPSGPVNYRYACHATGPAVTCVAVADLDSDRSPGAFVIALTSDNAAPAPIPNLPGAEGCPTTSPDVQNCYPSEY